MTGSRNKPPEAALYDSIIWGLFGGVGYAGTRLATALWGGREITARARALAVAQFVLAVLLAPAGAYAFTPIAMDLFPNATVPSTALMVGLCFNAVWPLLIEPKFLRRLIADMARGLADKLSGPDR